MSGLTPPGSPVNRAFGQGTLHAVRGSGAIQWIRCIDDWDGRSPVAVVWPCEARAERRTVLTALVARALDRPQAEIAIAFRPDRRPRLERPHGRPLGMSMSSRGTLSAVALGATRIGIDVERVGRAADIPAHVLHPVEIGWLASLAPEDRARDFARLWTLKEAYLKALGTGLARDTRTFAVALADPAPVTIEDQEAAHLIEHVSTVWVQAGAVLAAVSVVLVGAVP